MTGVFEQSLHLGSEEETREFARMLSLWARPGMVILLVGDLGMGKSVLARAFIAALLPEGSTTDIPSPTFSLVQSYDETRIPVFHADLYRLRGPDEVADLGLAEMLASHCGVIEWGDKLPTALGPDSLTISLSGSGSTREATVLATGAWAKALIRNGQLAQFLQQSPWQAGSRRFFEGDASARRYELVRHEGRDVLLMDMPQRPDGPPVKDGKPYSAIAHLAEGITAVVAINGHLVKLGYSAPQTLACDLAQGLALIEPLGHRVYGKMTLAGEDMREPLEAAAEVLADMALKEWPAEVEARPGFRHRLSAYDEEALLIEADLLPSWYFPYARGQAAPPAAVAGFVAIWKDLMPFTMPEHPVWTLRDYHSPNLLWIPERQGLRRVGIIDTQDAVLGHPAYDLMSMCQDARVDIAQELQDHVVAHYCALRHKQAGHFDEASFRASYAVLGAQRATKILGIFARLSKRDGKHGYLRHMPRVANALRHNLSHPVLAPLQEWYLRHLPEIMEQRP